MIKWDLTAQKYNREKTTNQDKIIVECEACHQLFDILLCTYKATLRRNDGHYRCHACKVGSTDFKKQCKERAVVLWQNPKYSEKNLASVRTVKYRESHRESTKELWKKADFLKKMTPSEEQRQASSIRALELWKDEQYRTKMLNHLQSPESRRKKKRWWEQNVERKRAQISAQSRKLWQDPNFVNKIKTSHNSPDFKMKMSEIGKKKWQDETFRVKMAEMRVKQSGIQSKPQLLLYGMLNDLNVKHTTDKDKANAVGYFVWDCRIDPQEGLNLKRTLLIDVQGTYWHSLPANIRNDRAKATYISRYFPNIDVKYVWEHEFNARDRVRSLLCYWLGTSEMVTKDYDFKSLSIKVIDADEADLFISKYHYAGRLGRGGIKFGAFFNDVLIAVCVYSQTVRQETAELQGCGCDEILELSRFCIHPSYQKKNLATWFIAHSLRAVRDEQRKIKKIVAFSDLTFNHEGTIYEAGNWRFDGIVKPDYWYVDQDGYVVHKKTLWNHASKMSLTEREYRERFGYTQVWGREKHRFIYEL